MKKKIVYIAHPIGGNVQVNIALVLGIIKHLNLSYDDIVPFAPYLVDCLSMNDDVAAERARGIENNIALFKSGVIDELWLYGTTISKGMQGEIDLAEELGIPVISMSKHIEYVNRKTANTILSTKDYLQLRNKAEKWDTLDNKLSEIYGDGEASDEEDETDLTAIGEIAAEAFGYL